MLLIYDLVYALMCLLLLQQRDYLHIPGRTAWGAGYVMTLCNFHPSLENNHCIIYEGLRHICSCSALKCTKRTMEVAAGAAMFVSITFVSTSPGESGYKLTNTHRRECSCKFYSVNSIIWKRAENPSQHQSKHSHALHMQGYIRKKAFVMLECIEYTLHVTQLHQKSLLY